MIHLNSAIKTTAVIIRLEIVTPIQTVDDGSAGCNNYTLLLLDRLTRSSIPDLLSSVLFSQNRLTETSGCCE